jgi:hypothetical protein
MKLVIIFGPGAVGKMTVGKELATITDFKLFHNHMSLELANQFFDWSTDGFKKIDRLIRFGIFEIVASSDAKGLIFTFVWVVDEQKEEDYIDSLIEPFTKVGAEIHYVELYADLEERLRRNKTELRLKEKPSKRDTAFTEQMLLTNNSKYKLNTTDGDLPNKDILKIDNTHLTPQQVAQQIKEHYQL